MDDDMTSLVLFFRGEDGQAPQIRVLTKEEYTASPAPAAVTKELDKDAVLTEVAAGAGTAYFLNLSKMLDPGLPPFSDASLRKREMSSNVHLDAVTTLADGDLLIQPSGESQIYLVKEQSYTAATARQPGDVNAAYDIASQGAVTANVFLSPSPAGFTCFMLNLLALRSGAATTARPLDRAEVERRREAWKTVWGKSASGQ